MSSGNKTRQSKGPCGISSFIPLGMSCRGRAEAFARRLQSKLRTLGSQDPTPPSSVTEQPSSDVDNDWPTSSHPPSTTITTYQTFAVHNLSNVSTATTVIPSTTTIPNNEADACFDFDIELESPGSPAEECEYKRLLESVSTTTSQDVASESGYVCSSSSSTPCHNHKLNGTDRADDNCSSADNQSISSDEPYFDPDTLTETTEQNASVSLSAADYYDCVDSKREYSDLQIGRIYPLIDSDSCSESLPNSQSTTTSLSACTPNSASNYTLQDETLVDLCSVSKSPSYRENHFDIHDNVTNGERFLNGHQSESQERDLLEEHINRWNFSPSLYLSTLPREYLATDDCVYDSTTPELSPERHHHDYNSAKTRKINGILPINDDQEDDTEEDETRAQEQETITDEKTTPEFDEFEPVRPPRLRRCSSLKSGKTPPGTPSRKKIVRFADVLGLDLADVKTFLDEVPTVPLSAYEDLEVTDDLDDNSDLSGADFNTHNNKIILPMFQQPAGRADFIDLVRSQQVCLENAIVSDPICLTITGCVRVRNLDFNKSVHIRYTLNGWKSYADFQASYIEKSCDGFSDKFSFTIFGNSLQIGEKIEMAIRFSCKGQQFWDNNFGANYCFQCLPSSPLIEQKTLVTAIGMAIGRQTNGCSGNDDDHAIVQPSSLLYKRNSLDATFY